MREIPPSTAAMPDPDKVIVAYFINFLLPEECIQTVQELQHEIKNHIGESVWIAPPESLHITVLGWIEPSDLTDWDQDNLFKQSKTLLIETLKQSTSQMPPIEVNFNRIQVSPTAIFISGNDNGSVDAIRDSVINNPDLPAPQKKPPQIVHSTICKFNQKIDLRQVEDVVSGLSINHTATLDTLLISRETKSFMLEYSTVHEFPLGSIQ